ncbi:MAG: PD-(D/E)XK nuclease family transposase [Clostridia bacterium]|nr:PD-(D/E)XK nuclease family transposase [Clostridia bacterium]
MILKERTYKPFNREENSIRNDIIFRYVFGTEKNKKYLAEMIKSLVGIDIDIDSLTVKNDVALDKIHADNKNMRLDILADIGGNISLNIEIQNKEEYNIIDRTDNYASYIRTDSLKFGKEHSAAKKNYCCMDFRI